MRSSALAVPVLAAASLAFFALPAAADETTPPLLPVTSIPAPPLAPAPTPAPRTIVAGVSIAGIPVAGLTGDQALSKVRGVFATTIVVSVDHKQTYTVPVTTWGQTALVKRAVRAAVARKSAGRISVGVKFSGSGVLKQIALISSKSTIATIEPSWAFGGGKGRVVRGRDGLIVPTKTLKRALVKAIRQPVRRSTPIAIKRVKDGAASPGTLGPAVVIQRSANRLTLWTVTKKGKPVVRRTFGVATGQPSYPTPSGLFHIYSKQRNPWWYPPKGSAWVTDPTPVPPGPGNPLGTRWMEFAPAVGMHGTPDAASIGYSASHGCVRMHIPDAEWLFDHVSIGTPVRVY